MFLTHFGIENFLYRDSEFCVENQMGWCSELSIVNIINIMTLKNLIEIIQLTLNDPKFDIKKSLDTLLCLTTKKFQESMIKTKIFFLYRLFLIDRNHETDIRRSEREIINRSGNRTENQFCSRGIPTR